MIVSESMHAPVGFIGLGAMGAPMARRLITHGFDVTVFDVVPARVEELADIGARAASTPRDVARGSAVIVTMLPDDPELRSAVGGVDGIIAGLAPGALLIDMSTVSPAVSRQVAGSVEAAGARMIDAPVGRTSRHAEEGDLLIMVGGADDDVDRAIPILECFGHDIVRCGAIGNGVTMKLVNNLLTASIVAADAEALVLGAAAGLPVETMLRVLRNSGASNAHLATTYRDKALRRDFSPGFATRLAVKDLRLGLGLAIENQLPVGVGAAALQMFSTACSQGHATDDYTSVITVLERLANLEVSETVEQVGAHA